MVEAGLAIAAERRHAEKVSFSCSKYPSSISADFNSSDRVPNTRQQRLSILSNLFVKSDFSLIIANRKPACEIGADGAELVVSFIGTIDGDSTLGIKTWIDRENVLTADTSKELGSS